MCERGPWFESLRERAQECYAAPMLSRAEALALLDIAEAASEARDALAGIVVMLGSNSGDPMGTARKHFERLNGLLASRAENSQKEPK